MKSRLSTLKPRPLGSLPAKVQPPTITPRKTGSSGMVDRDRIRKRDKYLCQQCRREGITRALDAIDHIVPLWQGGSDADENKEGLCKFHHDEKSRREDKDRPRPPTAR